MAGTLTSLLVLGYGMQLVYHGIFHTPLSFYSLTGAGEAFQFVAILLPALQENGNALAFLALPFPVLLIIGRKLPFTRVKRLSLAVTLALGVVTYSLTILCVHLTGEGAATQYTLYYKTSSPVLSVSRLGILTTMRLDLQRLAMDLLHPEASGGKEGAGDKTVFSEATASPYSTSASAVTAAPEPAETVQGGIAVPTPGYPAVKQTPTPTYNSLPIDFDSLTAAEKDPVLKSMHRYFASVKPSLKNEYTGMFKGCNLILITAESFSPYAIDAQRTPTLYKMEQEGFVFRNFYNPLWGVSTSDGEYVACTGLIPKDGVWSFARSGGNFMPFAMGNQFRKLGYLTKAYHNHSYTYYKRNISHPNMGYDYKGVGNGLKVKKTWPESDLEMVEATVDEFVGEKPFHTYYMTVSGHMNYSFSGNFMAQKNKALVADLPLSAAAKAYVACNMELESAMKALLDKLEAAGVADKTVIAVSADHYPYGLPKECIDELAGHKVEENFELYRSPFLLWKKGMKPVVIDKPCSSLDIIPTLSNLFDLPFDSRLLSGSDILSDTSPLVIFCNRSWITDKAVYNSASNKITFVDGTQKDDEYIKAIHKIVADKFSYAAKILETDYYGKVVTQDVK